MTKNASNTLIAFSYPISLWVDNNFMYIVTLLSCVYMMYWKQWRKLTMRFLKLCKHEVMRFYFDLGSVEWKGTCKCRRYWWVATLRKGEYKEGGNKGGFKAFSLSNWENNDVSINIP